MRPNFPREGDPQKPGLRVGLRPGDKIMINDSLEVEFIGVQGKYIRLLFLGNPEEWKITRKPEVKS